ncbi:MAG: histidine--tRNA ligase [Spirulinaceae cyanobacterium]
MRTTKIERVRGVNDILPDICTVEQQIAAQLSSCFQSFGYRPIDVPILEYTELYLRKSGEELISRMYDFTFYNRRLCLRPEFTASIVRAYIDNLQGQPLPLRLYYQGPVFRYEKPQRGKYRQFTQMGVEMLGAGGAMADAEAIATACKALGKLGLSNYRLVIGHINVLSKFLGSLNLENRLSSFLLANMEVLRREGREYIEKSLQEIYPYFGAAVEDIPSTNKLTQLFQHSSNSEARLAILELVESMNINLDDTRPSEEIAERLLDKIKHQDQNPAINKALGFMAELGQIKGKPEAALPQAEKVLKAYEVDSSALGELRDILKNLESYDINQESISLDFGMSRGLQYYTGTIFEIHHGDSGKGQQLCGGGRYDELVATLSGKKNIPATGFSFGMERLRLALEEENLLPTKVTETVDVLVIPVTPQEYSYGIQVAEKLRHGGLKVELDVRSKNVSSNLQYAVKQGIPFAVILGSQEEKAAKVMLRDLAANKQEQVAIGEVLKLVEG